MVSAPKYIPKHLRESKDTFLGTLKKKKKKIKKSTMAPTQRTALEFPHQIRSGKVK